MDRTAIIPTFPKRDRPTGPVAEAAHAQRHGVQPGQLIPVSVLLPAAVYDTLARVAAQWHMSDADMFRVAMELYCHISAHMPYGKFFEDFRFERVDKTNGKIVLSRPFWNPWKGILGTVQADNGEFVPVSVGVSPELEEAYFEAYCGVSGDYWAIALATAAVRVLKDVNELSSGGFGLVVPMRSAWAKPDSWLGRAIAIVMHEPPRTLQYFIDGARVRYASTVARVSGVEGKGLQLDM